MKMNEMVNGYSDQVVSEEQGLLLLSNENIFFELIQYIDVAASHRGIPYVVRLTAENEPEFIRIGSDQANQMNYWAILSVKHECTQNDLEEFNHRLTDFAHRFGRVVNAFDRTLGGDE